MKKTIQVQTPRSLSPAASPEQAFAESPLGAKLRAVLSDQATSPANRATADFLLRNPVRATAWGIEELAANAQTSTATLSRFARTLGMSGFSALRAEMAEVLQSVLQPVEKLRGVVQRQDGTQSVVSESLEMALTNARTTAQGLEPAQLARIAAQLAKARCVYVMGFGLSAHLAGILALDLQPFFPQVINVVEFGGTEVAAGRLMNIGKGDVLLAISFPRYADDAIRFTQYARDRGALTLALTDSLASPLAAAADEVLIAASTHPVLSSSSVSALLVVEALVTSVMISNDGHVQQAGRLTEAISAYLYSPKKQRSTRGL